MKASNDAYFTARNTSYRLFSNESLIFLKHAVDFKIIYIRVSENLNWRYFVSIIKVIIISYSQVNAKLFQIAETLPKEVLEKMHAAPKAEGMLIKINMCYTIF